MGEHKYNPTAIAAKKGELPPKPKSMTKAEADRWLARAIAERTGLPFIVRSLGGPYR